MDESWVLRKRASHSRNLKWRKARFLSSRLPCFSIYSFVKGICFAIFVSVSCQRLTAEENSFLHVQKPANQLIRELQKPIVKPRLLDKATPSNVQIYISLQKQRAYLFVNREIAIDTPISSGKRKGITSKGDYTILDKSKEYRSTVEGNFVDRKGRVVQRGVNAKLDSAPSGTVFAQAPVKFFMRLTRGGLAIYAGMTPGYPASSGAIWMPEETARLFFETTEVGTPVVIGD